MSNQRLYDQHIVFLEMDNEPIYIILVRKLKVMTHCVKFGKVTTESKIVWLINPVSTFRHRNIIWLLFLFKEVAAPIIVVPIRHFFTLSFYQSNFILPCLEKSERRFLTKIRSCQSCFLGSQEAMVHHHYPEGISSYFNNHIQ